MQTAINGARKVYDDKNPEVVAKLNNAILLPFLVSEKNYEISKFGMSE